MKALVVGILLIANQAMASGMIWNCTGEQSKMSVISGWMSVKLHSADLQIAGEEIHFGWEERNRQAKLQEFNLEKYVLVFLPLKDFIETDRNATATVVIYSKNKETAVDTLSCVGH